LVRPVMSWLVAADEKFWDDTTAVPAPVKVVIE
jgi:hypothetical protein